MAALQSRAQNLLNPGSNGKQGSEGKRDAIDITENHGIATVLEEESSMLSSIGEAEESERGRKVQTSPRDADGAKEEVQEEEEKILGEIVEEVEGKDEEIEEAKKEGEGLEVKKKGKEGDKSKTEQIEIAAEKSHILDEDKVQNTAQGVVSRGEQKHDKERINTSPRKQEKCDETKRKQENKRDKGKKRHISSWDPNKSSFLEAYGDEYSRRFAHSCSEGDC